MSEFLEWNNFVGSDRFKKAIPTLRSMLDAGQDINVRDKNGRTPLIIVLADSGTVKQYEESSSGCSSSWIEKITTPEKRKEIVRFLLQHGADINAVDNFGMNALGYAVDGKLGNQTLDMVEYLFSLNVKLDTRTKAGLNVFAYAHMTATRTFGRGILCTDERCKFCFPSFESRYYSEWVPTSCVENYLYIKADIK